MFAKPYKHKSVNTLKNSEKKQLVQRVQNEFGLATEEKAKELVPLKSSCLCMRVVVHSGDTVSVYSVDGEPMLLETSERLVPTVCALWKVPGLVPTLNIHTLVFPKIQGGAPLYLPGVNLPAAGIGFPIFQIGKILAARTEDNAAACVVGRAAMSSADMLLRPSGICLDTLHFFGDQLCKDDKFSKIKRPTLDPGKISTECSINLAADIQQLSIQPREQWPTLGKQAWPTLGKPEPAPLTPSAPLTPVNEPRLIPEAQGHPADEDQNGDADDNTAPECAAEDEIPTDMDELLQWCLLSFLKLDGKSVELPLKTNLLYKNHLQPLCPADRTIDVKKSSYKKVGKFLEAMQQEGLVEVRPLERGVDAVVAINLAHPRVRRHRAARPAPPAPDAPAPAGYVPPLVREMYCITAAVLPLFPGLKKGSPLTSGEVRGAVNEYAKLKGLPAARGSVTLDDTLAKILKKPAQECVRWEAVMSGVLGAMTAATEMRFADGTARVARARLEPIAMTVHQRSGNKKVTLVSNLESFGFSLPALARSCQLGAAATCGVTRAPGAKHDQLMLQGDQTHFVAKLLIEKYGLPKKFVEGADKALNKKNK